MAISPSRIGAQIDPRQFPGASPEAHTLARWVYRSYRYNSIAHLSFSLLKSGILLLNLQCIFFTCSYVYIIFTYCFYIFLEIFLMCAVEADTFLSLAHNIE
jgi:hypothetical protein